MWGATGRQLSPTGALSKQTTTNRPVLRQIQRLICNSRYSMKSLRSAQKFVGSSRSDCPGYTLGLPILLSPVIPHVRSTHPCLQACSLSTDTSLRPVFHIVCIVEPAFAVAAVSLDVNDDVR